MCSLGRHQEGEDVRPSRRRRHLDGSAAVALADTPDETLAQRRVAKHAQLKAEVAGNVAVPLDADQFQMNFEPLPPGVEQLPDHLVDHEPYRDPRNWWSDRQ